MNLKIFIYALIILNFPILLILTLWLYSSLSHYL